MVKYYISEESSCVTLNSDLIWVISSYCHFLNIDMPLREDVGCAGLGVSSKEALQFEWALWRLIPPISRDPVPMYTDYTSLTQPQLLSHGTITLTLCDAPLARLWLAFPWMQKEDGDESEDGCERRRRRDPCDSVGGRGVYSSRLRVVWNKIEKKSDICTSCWWRSKSKPATPCNLILQEKRAN